MKNVIICIISLMIPPAAAQIIKQSGSSATSSPGVFSNITATGNVGIGTASPCSTCTLHVAGGASVTGALESKTLRVIPGSGLGANFVNGYVQLGDDNSAASPSINFGGRNHGFFSGVSTIGVAVSGVQAGVFSANGYRPMIKTKAEIDAITPVLGDFFICSDCAVSYSICTATGTTLSGFRRADSTTAGCGTNN